MLRTVGFYLYFFTRGFFSFIGRWQAKRLQLDSVEATDYARTKIPRSWSKSLLKIVGANVVVKGAELPKGAVLFVANHVGSFDIPVLIAHLPKPFGFISKIEVLKIPVVGSWMKIMNCVFLDRKNRSDATKMFETGVSILKEGHSLLIFPEGTRSKGEAMKPFKAGSFKLAIDAGVPVVPIAIQGTADIMEKNGNIMKPATVTLTILPAIPVSEVQSKNSQQLAEVVHKSIQALVG